MGEQKRFIQEKTLGRWGKGAHDQPLELKDSHMGRNKDSYTPEENKHRVQSSRETDCRSV